MTAASWILDAPEAWSAPRGLMLSGERWLEVERVSEPVQALNLGQLVDRFGIQDPALSVLGWSWWSDETRYMTADDEARLLDGAALVSTVLGARIPLAKVPRLVGLPLEREGLAALGFASSAPWPSPSPALDVEDLAERIAGRLAPGRTADVYTTSKVGPHIPGKSREWMLRTVKTMPGARKLGRDWMISHADYERWAAERDAAGFRDSRQPSDEEIADRALAAAGLRRNGQG